MPVSTARTGNGGLALMESIWMTSSLFRFVTSLKEVGNLFFVSKTLVLEALHCITTATAQDL